MADAASFTEELPAGRDGEVQQPIAEERPLEQHDEETPSAPATPPPPQSSQLPSSGNPAINGGRKRLDGKPPQSPVTVRETSPPRRLRVTRNFSGSPSVRPRLQAAPEDAQVEEPTPKAALPHKPIFFGAVTSYPQHRNGLHDSCALLLRDTPKRQKTRSPNGRSSAGSMPQPPAIPGTVGNDSSTPHTASPAATASISPDCAAPRIAGSGYFLGEGGEMLDSASPDVEKHDTTFAAASNASRRVVHQSASIQRDADPAVPCTGDPGPRQVPYRGRVISPNDPLWRRERRHRYAATTSEGKQHHQDTMPRNAGVPQVVTEAPELPPALEAALADHFLATLMASSHSEVERVVSAISPRNRSEVLRYLRQTYGGRRSANTLSPASTQQGRVQSPQHTVGTATRRRHVSSTVRSIAPRNGTAGETNGTVAAAPKRVRHFVKCFTREVCMTFMDESCAVCAAHRDRMRAELPPGVQARGVPVPEDVLEPIFEQAVSQLLLQMLAWTEKEAARVAPMVVQQVKLHFPTCRRGVSPAPK
ncbi:hypothetical protein DQ04_07751000 [Trypanosoma grayi]|uniref:hypothetical protein n=1 Tax=Trypanosoma grayi TaxID=71804 RepID=UPI0004F429D3|nr:hypothetical protein DQ04_07751000 [Trypanosoma grayi]KEG08201.1 hypothetical protein DQ04_07751000 [Trypanosoma grayi]